jgi:DNA adenine methylase
MNLIKARPFVKWVGGKRQLINQFKNLGLLSPKDFDFENNKYFEPFIGGGAVFFEILPKNSIISDMNIELIKTYQTIKDNVEKLIDSLKKHKNNKEYFLEIRRKSITELDDLSIASRFIYLNKTAFNGMFRVNSRGEYNVPYGKYSNPLICDEDNLLNVSSVLQNVEIYHRDYSEVKKFAQKGDFIYFDPPYYPLNKTSSFTSYTKEGFLESTQVELRNIFEELSSKGCYVLLSNSDTDFIRNIYKDIKNVNIQQVFAGRAINSDSSKRGKITELVISNY